MGARHVLLQRSELLLIFVCTSTFLNDILMGVFLVADHKSETTRLR